MSWSRDPYGSAPYASDAVENTIPPGQQLPPDVPPGGTTRYTYGVQSGVYPWGMRSWAGGIPAPVWPGGGIILVPNSDNGTMRVLAWWPNASGLQLFRIDADGRTPVRGGYPIVSDQPTRRNYATNPSVETGLNGYVPSDGNPNLTQLPL